MSDNHFISEDEFYLKLRNKATEEKWKVDDWIKYLKIMRAIKLGATNEETD